MIEWINLVTMVLSSVLMLLFYLKSVSPAALAAEIGEIAYRKCYYYRLGASFFEFIVILTYLGYFIFPVEAFGLPQFFPWEWGLSIIIGIVILIPSGWLMIRGLLDAGKEAMAPQVDQKLYQGIYTKIRHPQALGELPLWWVGALFLNSPFLALYSFIFIPIFYIMVRAEEKDLILRFGEAYKEYRSKTGMFIPKRKRRL
ncbi:MAG: methyltransferase family protein [Candidatus Hodarchaeota archaeon]